MAPITPFERSIFLAILPSFIIDLTAVMIYQALSQHFYLLLFVRHQCRYGCSLWLKLGGNQYKLQLTDSGNSQSCIGFGFQFIRLRILRGVRFGL